MKIGTKLFDFTNESYIMGILNVTPDSFSDGGQYTNVEKALQQALKMIEEGAHIIDIGGESTRPGHEEVTIEDEINRVVPVIKALIKLTDTPLSIDTSKAPVAEAALKAGAHMVNDVWGLKRDPNLAPLCAKYDVPVCIMHNGPNTDYKDLMHDILDDLRESLTIASKGGIAPHHIMLDPGIGFAKTVEQNLQVMKQLEQFGQLGYPVLLGTSRKSMIGKTLDLPVDQRVEATIATTVLGYMKGCRIFRVHDVKENLRALRMTEAMLKS
jgi:dihydropteroate synthase